ncbi:MAG: 5'-nucleotidase C-terminal domain-containing protein [Oscillospiraceae bacterium]|nr:5'-nucleotidase C-terminal domain-containing protein [Oscillospiraceae bacterium]
MKRKFFKKPLAILLTLLLTFSLFPAMVSAAADDVVLTILHVNDRHGRMDADPYISRLAEEIQGNVLILDAGDALHGQTVTNLSKGETTVEVMNAVGYSAMVPGNHDFNFGVERLLELSEMMDFPLLAANVKKADGENLFQPYEVFKLDGVTVGVFGIVTPETSTGSDPRIVAGLTFDDPAKTAEAMVTALKAEGCDIIIALTHMGLDESSKPENRSDILATVPGIDIIIDAHSHDKLEEGRLVGDTLIAQTGDHGKNIGVIEITTSGKTARLIEVNDELTANESILAAIEAANAGIAHITETVVGSTPVYLNGERAAVRTGETNLANLIADSMLWATDADIAFLTGGNIRASIDAGEITMGQVLTVLPFSNLLVTVELTGAELLGVLEHGVSEYPEEAGKHIQVSGISFSFDPDAESGARVRGVKLSNGDSLDMDEVYTLATSEFLAFGGDGYDLDGRSLVYYGGDAEAFVDYLATNPTIIAEPEGRVAAVTGFDDVAKDAWYFNAVTNVTAMGLFPSGGSFNPTAPVTADEMSGWLKALIPDGDTSINGDEPLTREQLAVMLMDLLSDLAQKDDAPEYADADLIDGECLEAVVFAYKTDLMIGMGNGLFDPKGIVTRAQAATVLNTVLGLT